MVVIKMEVSRFKMRTSGSFFTKLYQFSKFLMTIFYCHWLRFSIYLHLFQILHRHVKIRNNAKIRDEICNLLGQLSLLSLKGRDLLKNLTILKVREDPGGQRGRGHRSSFRGFLLETLWPLLDQLGNSLQTRWCASSRVPRSKSNKDVTTFAELASIVADETDRRNRRRHVCELPDQFRLVVYTARCSSTSILFVDSFRMHFLYELQELK